jgi:glycosyltransferase involved in cell wall biosynthesis
MSYLANLGVHESNLRVLENGVDTSRFLPAVPSAEGRKALGSTLEEFLVICVAHHAPIKGLHVLLEAFEQFAHHHPNVHLSIIGEVVTPTQKSYSESLNAKVRNSIILRSRVTFHAPSNLIHQILPQADIVVQPSLSEAFGRIVIEASSCAIPIIASDTGGLKETVVDGRTGWLVPPGDATALARALAEAYLAPAIRKERGRLGAEYIMRYGIEGFRSKFFDICSSIQASKK